MRGSSGMNNIIFYFTGTGNSLHVASEIAKTLKDTRLVRITKDTPIDYIDDQFDRIGFVYPVYFGAVPNTVNVFFKKCENKAI